MWVLGMAEPPRLRLSSSAPRPGPRGPFPLAHSPLPRDHSGRKVDTAG